MPPDHRRVVGCLTVAAVLCGVLLLLAVAAVLAWKAGQTRRVDRALAEIRERGEPTDAQELQLWNSPTPGTDDSSSLWISALGRLEAASGARHLPFLGTADDPPPPGQPWAELPAAEQLLAEHAGPLQQLRQAAAEGGGVRFEMDFSRGVNMPLEHVQQVRNAARVLTLEAHVRAHRGDASGVAESILTMQRLAETLRDEPTLVSQLVRVAVCGITVDLCGKMLSRVEFSEQDLARLGAGFQALDLQDGLYRSLVGERVIGIVAYRDPSSLTDAGVAVPPLAQLNRDGDLAVYLEAMAEAIAIAQQPLPQARRELQSWSQSLNEKLGQGVKRVRYPLAAQLLPALAAAGDALARGATHNDVAATAVAIERYRRRHSRLPDRLEDLVPELLAEVPVDPFAEQPLRYAVRDGGYRVYSVGQDGVDHGGQPMADGVSYDQSDLVIQVPEK